ncbi:MAG: hypothetical protein CVU38_04055 [Chloroflexi bacterium HGW-Chloroflexi-1]|nr:MAG: hypothetical protein CVU38_04055 [Chloroflexi bacterium HGW-Chloroflexi-1]
MLGVLILSVLAMAVMLSFGGREQPPQSAARLFQSAIATPTSPSQPQVPTPTPPEPPRKGGRDIVLTFELPEIVPDVLTESVQLTTRPAPRGELAVDGNYVVWRSYEDGQTNVVAYNLQTGEERRISSLPGGKSSLRISGNYVVWEDVVTTTDRVIPVVRVYDLTAGKELAISSVDHASTHPDISGKTVVWNDGRNRQGDCVGDIYGYDLKRGVEFPVVVGPGCHSFPRVSGDWIIYLDWPPGAELRGRFPDQPTLHAHHIRTGEDINLGPASYRNDAWSYRRHVISGHTVAWQGKDGQVHLYDLAARREQTLTGHLSYDGLVLNGRFLNMGGVLYNVATSAKVVPFQPFSIERPAHVDDIATDGRTLAWIFNGANEGDSEGRIYVASFRRLP